MEEKYTDSDKYQQEIAEQYEKRVAKFSMEEVVGALRQLGIDTIDPIEIKVATIGNVNATYLTPTLVIKINKDKESPNYIPNKIVSDKIGKTQPVVQVISYDFFDKTDFEILVMERSQGTLLLDDALELGEKDQAAIFKQVLTTVKKLFEIQFADFGRINAPNESYQKYSDFLLHNFNESCRAIREQGLCDEHDLAKIEEYFRKNIDVFEDETSPVFVHTDLHMGNILHQGDKLTAILDFDSSLKAPKMQALISLLGFIDNPSQFVEGTKDFPKYKGKNFYQFLPLLKQELPEIFSDINLLKKLNLLFIENDLMWVADNWSADWNKEMIAKVLNRELPDSEEGLESTYYGKVLAHSENQR